MKEKKIEKRWDKRLILDVSREEHAEIKARAALRNVTMRQYIMEAILKRILEEKQYE